MDTVLQDVNIEVPKKPSNLGLYLASLTGGCGIAISIICFPFISPGFKRICLPYVPATTEQVKNILQGLKGRTGSLIDLGSGDGRIVIAAAQAGFQADGVELNPWLVTYSKILAFSKGISSKATFFKKDLWKFDLKKYDNIIIFGVDEMMEELEDKFRSELKANCRIVACRFPLPYCKPILIIGKELNTVWIYETPLNDVT